MQRLIKKAIEAVEKEIEAVRERPSQDILYDGERQPSHFSDTHHYLFKTNRESIRYADTVTATIEEEEQIAEPVDFSDKGVVLSFDEDMGELIAVAEVEWENDFVLRRLREQLLELAEAEGAILRRMEAVFEPDDTEPEPTEYEIKTDGQRNRAQLDAIEQAMRNRALFIWGPPGTGKTSTVGYIMANLLLRGDRVLFVSNTNRAVDVGLLSLLQALDTIGDRSFEQKVTRYGEVALEGERLETIQFDHLLDQKKSRTREEAAEYTQLLEQYRDLQEAMASEEDESGLDRTRMELLEQKIEKLGGEDAIEEMISQLTSVNELHELRSFRLIGTTLAKVCSSELFQSLDFDAVVVDEASMASLPYLLVMAAKADNLAVLVGDPMQLPPIALTNDRTAKKLLEKDIFTHVSGAESPDELFAWQDNHPHITAFFDTQYRLRSALAELISSTFYEGRLQSALHIEREKHRESLFLINTERFRPRIRQEEGHRGFNPKNEIHLKLIEKLTRKLVMKERVRMYEIGIIVPFRSAVYDIRELLRQEGLEEIEVGTIHTYQGREKRVIIFDTVMSGEQQYGRRRHYSVRPFDEEVAHVDILARDVVGVGPRLLNVAFSRSKSHLYVLADMAHINHVYHGKFIGRLLQKMGAMESAVTL